MEDQEVWPLLGSPNTGKFLVFSLKANLLILITVSDLVVDSIRLTKDHSNTLMTGLLRNVMLFISGAMKHLSVTSLPSEIFTRLFFTLRI